MHEMVEIPENFQTPEFKRLFILAEIGNFTASELEEYEKSLTSMSDYYNIIDSAEKRAREEGRAEGHAEGLAEGREVTIAKLVAAGFDREQIEAALKNSSANLQ
jgi:flagellar biosynthesis/type III secretory pathway protein FliH